MAFATGASLQSPKAGLPSDNRALLVPKAGLLVQIDGQKIIDTLGDTKSHPVTVFNKGSAPTLHKFHTAKELTIYFSDGSAPGKKLYTILMRDQDVKGGYLHYVLSNYGSSQPKELVAYVPPNPPSGVHTYSIEVYQQQGIINTSFPKVSILSHYTDEDVKKFITDNNLTFFTLSVFNVSAAPLSMFGVNPDPVNNIGVDPIDKNKWFRSDSKLDEHQKKYCRCVLEVAAKQPGSCNMEKAWFQERDHRTCYNPYAVCAKSVGVSVSSCGQDYDFNNIPTAELQGYLGLKGVGLPVNTDRLTLIQRINQLKSLSE
jgi:hypothetical protein